MKPIRLRAAERRRRLRRGVATLEIALAAPVILLLFLGTADLALWMRAVFRLDELTTQIGEIVTQCPVLNDPADFNGLFTDAQKLAGPVDVSSRTGGAFLITAMGITNGAPTILWQRRIGNPVFNSRFGAVNTAPVTGAFAVSGAEILIGTEAFSAMQPWRLSAMMAKGIPNAPQLYSQSLFLVRSSSPTQLATLGTGSQAGCVP